MDARILIKKLKKHLVLKKRRVDMARVFLSHTSKDSEFVIQVAQYLKRGMDVFYYEDSHADRQGNFIAILNKELQKATAMIFFMGEQLGRYQAIEIDGAIQRVPTPTIFVVIISNEAPDTIVNRHFLMLPPDDIFSVGAQPGQREVVNTARRIFERLNISWVARDGLPWEAQGGASFPLSPQAHLSVR
jgi:hypothetical protein